MGKLTKELVYKAIEDAEPRSSFRNIQDKIAFTVHAAFVASGFRLLATGPDAFQSYTLQSPSREEVSIENWNYHEDGFYGFIYIYPGIDSDKVVVQIIDGIRGDLLVYGSRVGDDSNRPRLQIHMDEYAPKKENEKYLSNFGKLVESIEKGLVNKFDASHSDTKYHRLRHEYGSSLAKCHCVEYHLIDIDDDGFVNVFDNNGRLKYDLRLPTDDDDLRKQIQDKSAEEKQLVVYVMISAKGEEYICAVKEIIGGSK